MDLGLKGMKPVKSMMILVDGSRSRPMAIIKDVVVDLYGVEVFIVIESPPQVYGEKEKETMLLGPPS